MQTKERERKTFILQSQLPVLLGDEGLVGLGVHELVDLLGTLLVNLDLDDPAAAVAVVLRDLVDGGGLLLKQGVAREDFAADRGVDVAGALDRLDGTNGVTLVDKVVGALRELNVDDITKLLGGVLGDANDARLAVGRQVNPLVVLGVLLGEACGKREKRANKLATRLGMDTES